MATKVKVKTSWGSKVKKTDIDITAETLADALAALQSLNEWGEFSGTIDYSSSDDGTNITEVVLKPTYTIHMPKWSGYSKAPKECQQEWDRMWKKLDEHEDGHKDVFLDALKTIEDTLKKKTDYPMGDLDTDFNKMIQDMKNKQKSFDSSTGNGSKKGITLTVSEACQ
jgi:predicted secreted Zn-dependent protease